MKTCGYEEHAFALPQRTTAHLGCSLGPTAAVLFLPTRVATVQLPNVYRTPSFAYRLEERRISFLTGP